MNDEWWRALSAEMARLPGVRSRLRAEHVDDGHGRCRGCSSHSVPRPWPCSLLQVAQGVGGRPAAGPDGAPR